MATRSKKAGSRAKELESSEPIGKVTEPRQPRPDDIFIISSDNRITIAGMTGTGKTTLAHFMLRKFSKVLVWDPLSQYAEFNHYVPELGNREEFEYVCKQVWDRGNVMLAVEEADFVLKEGPDLLPYTYKCMHQGRNRGIGVMAVTPRIADLSKKMFSLSNHVYLFKFFAPNDIDYIKGFLGREWAVRIRSLPDFHFVYYGGGDKVCECEPIKP